MTDRTVSSEKKRAALIGTTTFLMAMSMMPPEEEGQKQKPFDPEPREPDSYREETVLLHPGQAADIAIAAQRHGTTEAVDAWLAEERARLAVPASAKQLAAKDKRARKAAKRLAHR